MDRLTAEGFARAYGLRFPTDPIQWRVPTSPPRTPSLDSLWNQAERISRRVAAYGYGA